MPKISIPETEQYGSFKLVEVKGNHKSFMGLSSDVYLLPNNMKNTCVGSTAFCIDTGDVYFYDDTNKQWVQI